MQNQYKKMNIISIKLQDIIFNWIFKLAALFTLLMLAGIIVSLVIGAMPAIKEFGFGFFIHNDWDTQNKSFGAVSMIYGTVITSLIALIIAVPISFGIVIFLTELTPKWPQWIKKFLTTIIELLAGIPSIVFGMWGLFTFGPFLAKYLQEPLQSILSNVPILKNLFAGYPIGIGIFPASVILAIMIVPFISSVIKDVFEIVPKLLKESAYGLGSTTWDVVRHIIIPYTKTGIIGAIMLGLGRALGETMAITFIIGNSIQKDSFSLFEPASSITSILANEFQEASPGLHQASLIYLGLILFLITFAILAVSKIFLLKMYKSEGTK